MVTTAEHLLESQTSHISLDVEVITLQGWVKDLESKWEWLNLRGEDIDKSMERVQEHLDEVESSLDAVVKGVARNNKARKWTNAWSHSCSDTSCRQHLGLEHTNTCIDDLEDHLMLEIHCSHCDDRTCGPSGWTSVVPHP